MQNAVTFPSLSPCGLVMGTFFLPRIEHLTGRAEALQPWCCVVNRAPSAFAPSFSLAIGSQFGHDAKLVVGWAAHVVAGGVLLVLTLGERLALNRRVLGTPPAQG